VKEDLGEKEALGSGISRSNELDTTKWYYHRVVELR